MASSTHYDSERLKIGENLKKLEFSDLDEIFFVDILAWIY